MSQMNDQVSSQMVARILAWLMRNEGVSPEAVERAVCSAIDMKLGQSTTLSDDKLAALRRAFIYEQIGMLN